MNTENPKWHRTPKTELISKTFPHLVSEWSSKNALPIDAFFCGSAKKVWWECNKCGFLWETEVRVRTRSGCGCPECSKGRRVSKMELRVFAEMKSHFEDTKSCDKSLGYEIDVFVPSLKLGIEVDGSFWHKDRAKDVKKNNKAILSGIRMIRLRQNLERIGDEDVCYDKKESQEDVIKTLLGKIGLTEIKGRQLYKELLIKYRRVNPENNLRNNFPELCLEWSEKNYPLLPENFSRGSEYSAFWKCKRGHEWSARIDSRACGGNGCPVCAGKINEKVSDMEYAKEWSLNNLQNPEMISSTSHVKYLWYCLKHNFEFKASPNSRKFNKGGCPYCSGVLPEFKDSVASIRRFIELWDFTKNTLKPENLKAGSILKVWILNKFGKTEQVVVRDFIKRIKNGY